MEVDIRISTRRTASPAMNGFMTGLPVTRRRPLVAFPAVGRMNCYSTGSNVTRQPIRMITIGAIRERTTNDEVTKLPLYCLKFMFGRRLVDHMADEHEYECNCGESFENEEELKEHAREEHDADV